MRPLQRFCWVFRGRRRRLSATSLPTGNSREIASAGAVRLSETAAHAPDLLDRPVHDRLRRRFRPAVPARARRAARAAAARSAVRIGRPRHRLRVRGRRAGLVGVSSRAAGAGMARLFAMALVLAVARGRAVGRDRDPGGDLRDWLGVFRRRLGLCRPVRGRSPPRSRRARSTAPA